MNGWTGITSIAGSGSHLTGLRTDGNVQGWKNVVEISTVYHATIAMQEDRTILCTDPKLKEQIENALT